MKDTNLLVLIGRVTKDIGSDERSFGYVGNGVAKANVSIAVNNSKKVGDKWEDVVSFFDITLWGKTAENLKPYLKKGTQISIEGHLQQDRYEKDGQKISKISIIADNVQLLGGKKEGSSGNSSTSNSPAPSQDGYDPAADFPSDLPF